MKQILFSLLLSLLLMGCGGESENAALSDKAWAVERGQDKQSVYDFMKSQNLTITDEDSVLIGFKFDGVIWLNENWDMAIVKFNANSQATSVSLMMSHEFPKRKFDDAITCLTTLYGEVCMERRKKTLRSLQHGISVRLMAIQRRGLHLIHLAHQLMLFGNRFYPNPVPPFLRLSVNQTQSGILGYQPCFLYLCRKIQYDIVTVRWNTIYKPVIYRGYNLDMCRTGHHPLFQGMGRM